MSIKRRALRAICGVAATLIVAVAALVTHAAISGSRSHSHPAGTVPGSLAAFPEPTHDGEHFDGKGAVATRLGPGQSLVARALHGAVRVYASPRASHGHRLGGLPVGGHHAPLVFLVRRQTPGWIEVYLPTRPDRSTGWVRAGDVRLARTPYRLEVRLRAHQLLVWRDNHLIARQPIATGQAVTPTPHGRYFIADLLKPPDPNGFYGPYAFGLSAYSHVLTSFAGGDGQIGIHGTNEPAVLGSDVSHGCIRLNNTAITRLAHQIPIGTPVTITA